MTKGEWARDDRQQQREASNLRAICLDGGGYLGLATASFLQELERHFSIRIADKFDLFCGTSTGGIIALCLAHGLSASEIVQLYRTLGGEVFANKMPGARVLRWIRGLFFSRYSNKNLIRALTDTFGDATLSDIKARGKYIAVPAFCLSDGRPRVFKTDHSTELTRDDGYLLRDVALATSAAPTFLPIVSIKSPTSGAYEQFVDGGVFANNPTLVAFTEAIGYLHIAASRLRILSLSTPRDISGSAERSRPLSRWERIRLSRGIIGWGRRLAELFIGSSMQLTNSAVTRVMMQLTDTASPVERFDLRSERGLGLDIATRWATETLINIGTTAASQNDTRKRFGALIEREGGSGGEHSKAI